MPNSDYTLEELAAIIRNLIPYLPSPETRIVGGKVVTVEDAKFRAIQAAHDFAEDEPAQEQDEPFDSRSYDAEQVEYVRRHC